MFDVPQFSSKKCIFKDGVDEIQAIPWEMSRSDGRASADDVDRGLTATRQRKES